VPAHANCVVDLVKSAAIAISRKVNRAERSSIADSDWPKNEQSLTDSKFGFPNLSGAGTKQRSSYSVPTP
jgi:hypothetical protein